MIRARLSDAGSGGSPPVPVPRISHGSKTVVVTVNRVWSGPGPDDGTSSCPGGPGPPRPPRPGPQRRSTQPGDSRRAAARRLSASPGRTALSQHHRPGPVKFYSILTSSRLLGRIRPGRRMALRRTDSSPAGQPAAAGRRTRRRFGSSAVPVRKLVPSSKTAAALLCDPPTSRRLTRHKYS